jgi:hypothetical protein
LSLGVIFEGSPAGYASTIDVIAPEFLLLANHLVWSFHTVVTQLALYAFSFEIVCLAVRVHLIAKSFKADGITFIAGRASSILNFNAILEAAHSLFR